MAFKKGKLVFKQTGIANPAIMDNLVQQLRAYTFKSPAGGIGLEQELHPER